METSYPVVVDTVDFCAGENKNQLSSLMTTSVKSLIDEGRNIGTVILHRFNNRNCFFHVPFKEAETMRSGDDF